MGIVEVFVINSCFVKYGHRQNTRGDRFHRIPQVGFTQDGYYRFRSISSVQFRDLQVPVIDKAFLRHESFSFIDGFFYTPVQIIVAAFHTLATLREDNRLVQRIIDDFPFPSGSLELCLVAVGVVGWHKRRFFSLGDVRVLVKPVGRVYRG